MGRPLAPEADREAPDLEMVHPDPSEVEPSGWVLIGTEARTDLGNETNGRSGAQ